MTRSRSSRLGSPGTTDSGWGSLGHVLIEPGPEVKILEGGIRRRKRLGGLLNYYYREAA